MKYLVQIEINSEFGYKPIKNIVMEFEIIEILDLDDSKTTKEKFSNILKECQEKYKNLYSSVDKHNFPFLIHCQIISIFKL